MTTTRTKIIASLAVVGTVAAVAALVGINGTGSIASSTLGHSRLLQQVPSNSSEVAKAFQDFVVKHNKNYITKEEFGARQSIFAANLAHINSHDSIGSGYTLGINKFADMSPEEFNSMKGLNLPPKRFLDAEAEAA